MTSSAQPATTALSSGKENLLEWENPLQKSRFATLDEVRRYIIWYVCHECKTRHDDEKFQEAKEIIRLKCEANQESADKHGLVHCDGQDLPIVTLTCNPKSNKQKSPFEGVAFKACSSCGGIREGEKVCSECKGKGIVRVEVKLPPALADAELQEKLMNEAQERTEHLSWCRTHGLTDDAKLDNGGGECKEYK